MEKKYKNYIDDLTLKEKAEATVMQQGRCFVIERKENRGLYIGDNPRENADYIVETKEQRSKGYHPVSYPQAAAVAAGWNEEISEKIGQAMGAECKRQDMNVLLRPGVNIKRSPLCGRNFEYYSEDPVLAGKLGAAFIRGVQKEGTAACLKHYAVNSQEFERMTTNAVVSERALREIYLKPFEIAIQEGKPWTVMTSYNKVNGQWVPANEHLMKILRNEFGFDGTVISDAMAVHTEKVDSHRYGLDFEIGSRGVHTIELEDAIASGNLDESVLDCSIARMLELQEKTAYLEEKITCDYAAEHKTARQYAADEVVLLKNDGILPLDASKKLKIAVIGKLAKEPNYMGCGSGHMNGWKVEELLTEVSALAGEQQILYADGYSLANRPWKEEKSNPKLLAEAVEVAKCADVVLVYVGLPMGYESEGYDRTTLELPQQMSDLLKALEKTGKKLILLNVSGAPVNLGKSAEYANAVVHSYLAGESMCGAIADVLFGIREPGGRLPETFPKKLSDTPAFLNFPHYPTYMPDVFYGEDIYVGYRWYDKRKLEVMYPFGYGLSYTTFAYSEWKLEEESQQKYHIRFRVKNTGKRQGSQVFQVYVGKEQRQLDAPEKELKAFCKVELEPGEEKEVQMVLPLDAFTSFDSNKNHWIIEGGEWNLMVGVNSREILYTFKAKVDGKLVNPYHKLTAMEWIFKDPHMKEILKHYSEPMQKLFGEADETMQDLICSIPIYRNTEPLLGGESQVTEEELMCFLTEMNERRKADD